MFMPARRRRPCSWGRGRCARRGWADHRGPPSSGCRRCPDRRPPRASLTLKRRQTGQSPAAIEAAWRAQIRLHRRWAHLDAARAKKRTTVAVAVARELACFVWEIAQQRD
jgi:hypothetical protein